MTDDQRLTVATHIGLAISLIWMAWDIASLALTCNLGLQESVDLCLRHPLQEALTHLSAGGTHGNSAPSSRSRVGQEATELVSGRGHPGLLFVDSVFPATSDGVQVPGLEQAQE